MCSLRIKQLDAYKKLISESNKPFNKPPSKCHRIEHTFKHDPGKRKPMRKYLANKVDEI